MSSIKYHHTIHNLRKHFIWNSIVVKSHTEVKIESADLIILILSTTNNGNTYLI